MAPPRFQCLNVARQATMQTPNLRAAFSTTHSPKAEPPFRSAASDLLGAISSPPSPPPSSPGYRYTGRTPTFSNPILQPTPGPQNRDSMERLSRLMQYNQNRVQPTEKRFSGASEVQNYAQGIALSKQVTRRFRAGDVYAPHDLSEVEMSKWKKRGKPQNDVFDVLDFNPLEQYRNFSVISEYMTPMGRIKHSSETGLRPVNQRRIAKAIRRSIGMGLTPSVHRHPELLYKMTKTRVQDVTPGRTDVPPLL